MHQFIQSFKSYNQIFILFLVLSPNLWGWGNTGHKIINRNAVSSFPVEMSQLLYWADSIAEHGSDADYRKEWDPGEAPKHYIDIDNYPEFILNGYINQNFDSLVLVHGYNFVMDQGILPWAIITTFDSLKAAFARYDWQSAMLFAADLGHYIGDSYMPLHITRNYNGQFTNQYGVHSRYESNLISRYSDQITYQANNSSYIIDISDYIFTNIYSNYEYVDSVLLADSIAHALAGNTTSSSYYQYYWDNIKEATLFLFGNASYSLSNLIYTAWIDAGSPLISGVNENSLTVNGYSLQQNYPNPFNPQTIINYCTAKDGFVTIKVFDILGNEIETLVNAEQPKGSYSITINSSELAAGIYIYQIRAGGFYSSKKMTLLK